MKLVDVLDVSEHDVVLVGESRWDFLRAAGHLPQVRLQQQTESLQLLLPLLTGKSTLPARLSLQTFTEYLVHLVRECFLEQSLFSQLSNS